MNDKNENALKNSKSFKKIKSYIDLWIINNLSKNLSIHK